MGQQVKGQQVKGKSANPFPDDRRLEIRVTFKASRPTFQDLLDRLRKETGVRLTADQQLEDQEATFALTVFNEPAWVVMNNIAKQMLTDGRWEKTENGYFLTGARPVPRHHPGQTKPSSPPPPKHRWLTAVSAVSLLAFAGWLLWRRWQANKGPATAAQLHGGRNRRAC